MRALDANAGGMPLSFWFVSAAAEGVDWPWRVGAGGNAVGIRKKLIWLDDWIFGATGYWGMPLASCGTGLVPEISVVPSELVLGEEGDEFGFVVGHAVVFFLGGDVGFDVFDV